MKRIFQRVSITYKAGPLPQEHSRECSSMVPCIHQPFPLSLPLPNGSHDLDKRLNKYAMRLSAVSPLRLCCMRLFKRLPLPLDLSSSRAGTDAQQRISHHPFAQAADSDVGRQTHKKTTTEGSREEYILEEEIIECTEQD